MKKIFTLMIAAAAIIFSACSGDNETPAPDPQPQETGPLTINQNTFRFGSKAVETFSLSIGNTTEWEVRNDAPWVITEKQADNTLRITATPSRLLVDRSATLTVAATNAELGEASFVVTQAHGTPKLYVRTLIGGTYARHCSENGRWATGQQGTSVVVVDIYQLTDENYTGTLTTLDGGVHSIDNNGNPYENGCSADGTIYTAYDTQDAVDNPGGEYFPARYIPYIMRNNRRIDLSYPSTYTTSDVTMEEYRTWHMYQGCIPDKMSADGKYIYGRLMNIQLMWFAAKWTRIGTTNNYTFKVLGLESDGDLNTWEAVPTDNPGEMVVNPVSFLAPQNISGLSIRGKYACGHYGSSLGGGGQLFRYDMEAEQLELLNATGIALHITDDGTLFTGDNRVYKLGSSTPMSLNAWLAETYGETIAGQISSVVMGSVSADYTTTVLFFMGDDETPPTTYIITVEP
jgi:hypothetical protein